ncbi:MAG: hypothetical protein A2087_00705 [Spirochaetes bacterium GWD1_61_31]|nr:MAG: hypothetical protein A2Y37_03130 [Spirochaetes bacterium GWB1_60_80]OHD29605.1 MAG: hypothetical protein A2004_01670 [Spirochaetes bacterium GWC1_61_12]OHD37508.1 MAG: hypothetical protein A2087_00705 [Spirochaetes bacterium GWD1_61_31]OHD41982.1 MAG: hypothetical protein A2Y35_14560 [Spirochaetes bacterium GWE1_60_18]
MLGKPNTMPAILPNNSVAMGLSMRKNRSRDSTDTRARFNSLDGPVKTFFGYLNQLPSGRFNRRKGRRKGRIAEKAIKINAAIDTNHITIPDQTLARNTVDDFLVNGYAQAGGIIHVIKKGRLAGVILNKLKSQMIQSSGAYPWLNRRLEYGKQA